MFSMKMRSILLVLLIFIENIEISHILPSYTGFCSAVTTTESSIRRKKMTDFDVFYENEEYEKDAPPSLVNKALEIAAGEILKEGTFSLSFVSEKTIQDENREYRGIDAVTDILTFVLDDGDDFFPVPDEEKEWGDILICTAKMKENAAQFNVSEEEELLRLLIHGLLHLSGLDHATNDFSTEPMLKNQENILQNLKKML